MTITYSDFLQTVAENEGEVLVTDAREKPFRVEKSRTGMRITPTISGKPRTVNAQGIQKYLAIFNATQSTALTDYPKKHLFHASYVVAVIRLWLGQKEALVPSSPVEPIDKAEFDAEFSAEEGAEKVRSHRSRERSFELVRMVKAHFTSKHGGRLFCEVCSFDFGATYGEPDFIEAHHRIPLRDLQPGTITKLSDLAMVCANCHRMLHRGNPWPTVEELKARFEVLKAARGG